MPKNVVFLPDEILREPKLLKMIGLSRSTVYRLEKENKFPKRIKISERAVGWLGSQVQLWIKDPCKFQKRYESSIEDITSQKDEEIKYID